MSAGVSRRLLKALLTLLFLAAIAAGIARALFLLPAMAEGNEMAPSIFRGDWVVAVLRATPTRGDVVLYEHPKKPGTLRLGRVIGLPGETVTLSNQIVSINGKELARTRGEPLLIDEEIVPGGRTLDRHRETGPDGRIWTILLDVRRRTKDMTLASGDGFVVLGDNRNHAVDSRELGPVPRGSIRGVVRYFVRARPVKGLPPRGTRVE